MNQHHKISNAKKCVHKGVIKKNISMGRRKEVLKGRVQVVPAMSRRPYQMEFCLGVGFNESSGGHSAALFTTFLFFLLSRIDSESELQGAAFPDVSSASPALHAVYSVTVCSLSVQCTMVSCCKYVLKRWQRMQYSRCSLTQCAVRESTEHCARCCIDCRICV